MRLAIIFGVLSALVMSAQGTSARTFLVVPGQSIQAAIDSSASGDTVSVAAGAYTESLDLKGKNILLAGAGMGTTVLTGAPGNSVVTFQSGETNACVLKGFTITGGEGHLFTVDRVGGGIYIDNAEPSIIGNEIRANGILPGGGTATWSGGGVYGAGDRWGREWSPRIVGNLIADNRAEVNGGGVYLWNNMSALVEDNHLIGNITDEGDGAGVAVLIYVGSPSIRSNVIEHNVAGDHGGGVYVASGASIPPTAEVSYNLIWSNQGKGTSTITSTGGGLYISGVDATVFRNTIVGNSGMWGGGIAIHQNKPVRLDRNIIVYSTGTELNCYYPTKVVATDNVFWQDPYNPFPADGACMDMVGTNGNVNLDPRLSDWGSGDTSISGDSPAAREGVAYAGAGEVRAGCLTAVERVTWGRVKAMYGH